MTVLADGQEAARSEITEFTDGVGTANLDISRMPTGETTVRATMVDGAGQELTRVETPFIKPEKGPWEDSRIGLDDRIIPPFTEITVGGAAAEISGWSPTVAHCRSTSQSESLGLTVDTRIEYDGMLWSDLTLTPVHALEVSSLTLHIPLRAEHARYVHHVRPSWLEDDAGLLPEAGYEATGFLPYIWLGDEDRGLARFAESERGWTAQSGKPVVQVVRQRDRVDLRIHIINVPRSLDEPLKLGFGLQATPVKPRPEETDAAGTNYYHYDHCGNTIAKQEADGNTYYQWDFENLMTRGDFADASHNYFACDADNKRTEKWDGDGYTRFIYQGPDMLKLLQERDDTEATVVQYTMGNGLEAMRRDTGSGIADGDSSFYHFDGLGSTFDLTDTDEAVTDTYRYNAWGEVLDRTGTTENPHTYVGKLRHYWNPEPVLYLLGFRYLDAATGRFWSVDPIGTTELLLGDPAVEGSLATNLMRYGESTPTALPDPAGLACCPDTLEVFHRHWDVDIGKAGGPYSVHYIIKFRARLKPGGKPQDCAVVQLIQGYSRDAVGFLDFPKFRGQARVQDRFPDYVVDSVDIEPRWASHHPPGGVVWFDQPARAWWQDRPGVGGMAQGRLPYKWHHRFNTGIYENRNVPRNLQAFEARRPDPLMKKTWTMYFKLYVGPGGQIELDTSP